MTSVNQRQLKMPQAATPREAYRQRQKQRLHESASLAEKFPRLKSVKADIEYFGRDNATRIGHIKYAMNVQHAKSVFCFECPNRECVCGDFDLTEVLAAAVAAGERSVAGEIRCPGWRNEEAIKKVRCQTVLRYKLRLQY
jgi:hypothetical protein